MAKPKVQLGDESGELYAPPVIPELTPEMKIAKAIGRVQARVRDFDATYGGLVVFVRPIEGGRWRATCPPLAMTAEGSAASRALEELGKLMREAAVRYADAIVRSALGEEIDGEED